MNSDELNNKYVAGTDRQGSGKGQKPSPREQGWGLEISPQGHLRVLKDKDKNNHH